MAEPLVPILGERGQSFSAGRDFGLYGGQPDYDAHVGAAREIDPHELLAGQLTSAAGLAPSIAPVAVPSGHVPAFGESADSAPAVTSLSDAGLARDAQPQHSATDQPASLTDGAVSSFLPHVQPAAAGDAGSAGADSSVLPSTQTAAGVLDIQSAADDAHMLASHVADQLDDAVSGPILTVSEAASDAADSVEMLGSDPAAGIQTLVSLVTAADMFDLRQEGVEPVTTSVDPAMDLADTLLADPDGDDAGGAVADDHHDDGQPVPTPIVADVADDATDSLGLGL